MTKTLAEYTPEERQEMGGMWCDLETPMGTEMVIYDQSRWSKETTLLEPGFGHFGADLSKVTPRFDLPRAWNPDGTPLDGDWLTHGTHTRVIPKNRRAFVTMSEEDPPTGKWKPDGEAEILRCI